MKFESLAPDLQQWLKTSIEQGHTAEALEQSLRTSGYQKSFARDAVRAARDKHAPRPVVPVPAAARPAVTADGPQPATAGPDMPQSTSQILQESPNVIDTGDRKVDILMVLNAPRVVIFGDLLAPEECDELVALSRTKLQRSTVVNPETGGWDVHEHRTSNGTHFERGENELVRRIETRLSELVGFPVDHGEPLQILNYLVGGEYRPHWDYFDPAQPGNEKVLENGGQRVATLIMYLNDVEAGGSTVFPDIGLDVLPRKGNAVYFAYTTDAGELDKRTLHGGSPVAQGEKWIATKWIRQQPFVR